MDNTKTLLLLGLATAGSIYYFKKSKDKKETGAKNATVQKTTQKTNDVLKLQKFLNRCGYGLVEDGIMGSKTRAALNDYKQWKSTPIVVIRREDGILKTRPNCTQTLLEAPTLIKYGIN